MKVTPYNFAEEHKINFREAVPAMDEAGKRQESEAYTAACNDVVTRMRKAFSGLFIDFEHYDNKRTPTPGYPANIAVHNSGEMDVYISVADTFSLEPKAVAVRRPTINPERQVEHPMIFWDISVIRPGAWSPDRPADVDICLVETNVPTRDVISELGKLYAEMILDAILTVDAVSESHRESDYDDIIIDDWQCRPGGEEVQDES